MSKIGIHRPGALGDIVTLMNLHPILSKRYKNIDIYVDKSNYVVLKDFANSSDLCSSFLPSEKFIKEDYDNWVEPCGYPFHLGFPNKKMEKHLGLYFLDEIGFCEKDMVSPTVLSYSPPDICEKDLECFITIQVKTGWSIYKEWDFANWIEFVAIMKNDYRIPVYQIGGPSDPIIRGVSGHFIGKSFLDNLSAQCWARAHVGLDSVFNHTSNISWSHKSSPTKSVILFGSTNQEGFGYTHNFNITSNLGCHPCYKENPQISNRPGGPCPYSRECMKKISVSNVVEHSLKLC